MEPVNYNYIFKFSDGREEHFEINLDGETLEPLNNTAGILPEWTRLDFHQCENCPLQPEQVSHCPLASNLIDLVERLGDVLSFDEVGVTVIQGDRTITRSAAAQEGISALMGVITATSGCPHTAFFKPMARFHLPFSNTEETLYRAASMYMLGQYYRWQNEMSVDLDLKGLIHFYRDVAEVNRNMANRLRAEKREDGTINALVLLDMFAKTVPDIEETLKELEPLFKAYLEPKLIELVR